MISMLSHAETAEAVPVERSSNMILIMLVARLRRGRAQCLYALLERGATQRPQRAACSNEASVSSADRRSTL